MTTPPLLLAAALLFWGWRTGLLPLAALVALALEGARVVRSRWDLSRSDFNRVSDLCAVLFGGIAVYLFATTGGARTGDGPRAVMLVFQWLPVVVAPLIACQVYSTAGRIDIGVFFWSLRRKPTGSLDVLHPYFALCLLAASATDPRTPWFYVGLSALVAWALWGARSRRASPAVWLALLTVASVLGYAGHVGLHRLQQTLERIAFEWISEIVRGETDPYRAATAIGQLGQLKLGNRIVLRVEPPADRAAPLLLRDASYNVYSSPAWFAIDAGFAAIQPEADGETWKFQPGPPTQKRVTVSAYLRRGRGVLTLPNGAFEIERLGVVGVSRNRLGAVKVDEGLGLITYTALFGPNAAVDGPPDDTDLRLPPRDAAVLTRIAGDLGLAGRPHAEVLATVAAFFRQNFRYSMYLPDRPPGGTPLADFLLRTRAGHCEYFATATVLLLRAAGLPARYATGYSVQEWSRLERWYVVRSRHAHSWALVWVDGAWRDVDTTPAVWAAVEGAGAPLAEPLFDLWSWGAFLFSRWRWSEGGGGLGTQIGWLLIPLFALLAWRLYSRRRVARGRGEPEPEAHAGPRPGDDSEFYAIEARLRDLGLGRRPDEPLAGWARRVDATDSLRPLVSLHYRHRFDPNGLSGEERAALRAGVRAWLAEHRAAERVRT